MRKGITTMVLQGEKKKSSGWWWKILLIIILLSVVGLSVLILNIDSIAGNQINKALNQYLAGGGKLDSIDVRLGEGSVAIEGLTVNQPKGYGTTPLLKLSALSVDTKPLAILSGKLVVETLMVKEVSLVVVRNKQGQLCVTQLAVPSEETKDEASEEGGLPNLPDIHVNSIRVETLSIKLIDEMLGTQWTAAMGMDIAVDDLQINDLLDQDILVGRFDLAVKGVKVDQPAGFAKAPLLTVDKVEVASRGVDLKSGQLPVNKILVDRITASPVLSSNGEISVQRLITAWTSDNTGSEKDNLKQKETPSQIPFKMPTAVFKDIQLKRIAVQLLGSIDGSPWQSGVDNVDVAVKGLAVGDIAKKAVKLDSFDMELKGFTIDEPPGYGSEKMFSLAQVAVSCNKMDMASKESVIEKVLVDGMSANIIIHPDETSNLQKIVGALMPVRSETKGSSVTSGDKPPARASVSKTGEKPLPVILVEKIDVKNGSIKHTEELSAKETLVFGLEKITVDISHLRLFDTNVNASPAAAMVSLELEQPQELPTGYFGSCAEIGPLGVGPLEVNSQVRLTGLKLDSLGSLIPPATRTSLGATGLDASVSLALNKKMVDLKTSVLTDKNIRYNEISVHGPVDNPEIELGPIFAGAFNRVSKGVFNIGAQGVQAGFEIAKGGVNVAKEVGSGAIGITKSIGKGVLNVGAGLITADVGRVAEGVVGTTKGTVSETFGTVKDAGSAAGSGVKGGVSDLAGGGTVFAWDQKIPERHKAAMQDAEARLEKMVYPPAIK